MPQLQVISHEQDPGQQQMLDASKNIADTIQKTQALKLTAQYYKIQAKNAQTEEDKARLDRLSKLTGDYLPQIANTTDPATKANLIKAIGDSGLYQGNTSQLFHDISDSMEHVQRNYSNIPSVQKMQQEQQAQQSQQQPPQPQGTSLMDMQPSPGVATPGNVAAANVDQSLAAANASRAQAEQSRSGLQYMGGLASALKEAKDARPFWESWQGKQTPAMKAVLDQMSTSAENSPQQGNASRVKALNPDSPGGKFIAQNAPSQFPVGTKKQKGNIWYQKAADGGWDPIPGG